MERKAFKATNAKTDDKGHVNFRFAQLGVLDKGNDVIMPGAFEQGKQIAMSAYNHSSWGTALPVGKGQIKEDGPWATFDGDFFTDTQAGNETYKTVKNMGDLQEYSFGYDVADGAPMQYCKACEKQVEGDFCPTCGGPSIQARKLKSLVTYEASPVLLGQGIDTGTNNIKSLETKGAIPYHDYGKADPGMAWDGPAQVAASDTATLKKICAWYDSANPDVKSSYKLPHHDAKSLKSVWRGVAAAMGRLKGTNIPDGDKKGVYSHLAKHYKEFDKEPPSFDAMEAGELKFVDEAAFVLADVQEFLVRARSVADWKAGKGKEIGVESKALIQEMVAELGSLRDELVRLVKLANSDAETSALLAQINLNMQEIEGALQ